MTSVSGYIRAAPGRGRVNRVVPSGLAARVSKGIPLKTSLARSTTAVKARLALLSLVRDYDDGVPLGGAHEATQGVDLGLRDAVARAAHRCGRCL